MEPVETKVIPMAIIHIKDGWYVVNAKTRAKISGPYQAHADAIEVTQTHAYRLNQGWAI